MFVIDFTIVSFVQDCYASLFFTRDEDFADGQHHEQFYYNHKYFFNFSVKSIVY